MIALAKVLATLALSQLGAPHEPQSAVCAYVELGFAPHQVVEQIELAGIEYAQTLSYEEAQRIYEEAEKC